MIAVNLQTSFLTPPFGFALFYLRGVAPKEVTTGHIYRGVIPFVLIQVSRAVAFVLVPMGRNHHSEPLGGIDQRIPNEKECPFLQYIYFCAIHLCFVAMCYFRHGDLSHLLRDRLTLT